MASFTKFTMSASFPHQRREKKKKKHRNCPERPSDSRQLYYFTCDFISQNLGIFKDNVRIFCLSCNIKKYITPAKLSQNNWNVRHSNLFQWCYLWRQHLYCYRFFLLLYMNQVPEMLKFIWLPLLVLTIAG